MQTNDTMRIARLTALIGLSLLGACTTGNTPPDPTGRLCTTNFTVTGTFTQSMPRPADHSNDDGCWPVGMWKFNVAVDTTQSNTCSPAPMPLSGGYQFEGDLTPDMNDPMGPPVETFKYDTDPSVENHVSVTEGGTDGNANGYGACAGELDLWDAACTHVWTFQPEANTYDPGGMIAGQATYSEFSSAHCPFGDPMP